MDKDQELVTISDRVIRGEIDPYSTAIEILRDQAMLRDWLSKIEKEE
jgi:hypothetical protein